MNVNMDLFVREYIRAILWSNSLDDYSIDDIHYTSVNMARSQCAEFVENNTADVILAIEETSLGHVAHDFCLTRNHEGCGFWDGDYSEDLGDRLTEASDRFSELMVYVGDDGYIYIQ